MGTNSTKGSDKQSMLVLVTLNNMEWARLIEERNFQPNPLLVDVYVLHKTNTNLLVATMSGVSKSWKVKAILGDNWL